eukprot:gene8949-11479_t
MAAVVEVLSGYSPVLFSKDDVANRITGAIKMIRIHADNGDTIPWLSDFDEDAFLKSPAMLWTLVRDGHTGQSPILPGIILDEDFHPLFRHVLPCTVLKQSHVEEQSIDIKFGSHAPSPMVGYKQDPRTQSAKDKGWKGAVPLLDEMKYTKELYWSLLARSPGMSYRGETVIGLCRSSVLRLIEMSLHMLNEVAVQELEFSGNVLGFGLTSIEESFGLLRKRLSNEDNSGNIGNLSTGGQNPAVQSEGHAKTISPTEVQKILQDNEEQLHRYFGALSIHLERVGQFRPALITGTSQSTVTLPSLSPNEVQYLISLVFHNNSVTRFRIGAESMSPVRLQSLHPFFAEKKADYSRTNGYRFRISGTAELLVVMTAVLECDELAAVDGDRRIADVNLTATPIGHAIKKSCQASYFQTILDIKVDGDFLDKEKSKMLLPIMLKFASVTSFDMRDRISGDDAAAYLIPAIKFWANNLVSLYLGSDDFGDVGGIEVAKLIPLFNKMKRLHLRRSGLTDVAGMAIVEALKQNQNIKEVLLNENMFTDAIVNSLVSYILIPSNLDDLQLGDN